MADAPLTNPCSRFASIGAEAVSFLTEQLPPEPTAIDLEATFGQASRHEEDFSEVRGQESVKRALVAAPGGHNILTSGTSASSSWNPSNHKALRAQSVVFHRARAV